MNTTKTFTERAAAFACSLQGRMMPTEATQLLKDMAAALDALQAANAAAKTGGA